MPREPAVCNLYLGISSPDSCNYNGKLSVLWVTSQLDVTQSTVGCVCCACVCVCKCSTLLSTDNTEYIAKQTFSITNTVVHKDVLYTFKYSYMFV